MEELLEYCIMDTRTLTSTAIGTECCGQLMEVNGALCAPCEESIKIMGTVSALSLRKRNSEDR